jgi:hypothetical protein
MAALRTSVGNVSTIQHACLRSIAINSGGSQVTAVKLSSLRTFSRINEVT